MLFYAGIWLFTIVMFYEIGNVRGYFQGRAETKSKLKEGE